ECRGPEATTDVMVYRSACHLGRDRGAMRFWNLVGKHFDKVIELVGFGRPERFVRIGATLRVLLDAFAQAAQPDSKFCPLHASHDEFRGAARIEDERAFERNAMTALRARLAPHDAELKRMDLFDGG